MNTRHQKNPGPLSQARYMSSSEFAELHGISGVAVSARAAVLLHADKRKLIWFIQGLSLAEGGLKRVARELVEMFPDRLGTPPMHKAGIKPEKTYARELVSGVEADLNIRDALLSEKPTKPEKGAALIDRCRAAALKHRETPQRNQYLSRWREIQSLEEFLVDLCINPRIHFAAPGEEVDVSDIESDATIEANPELSKSDFKAASLVYFRDIIGVLFEYKSRHESKIRENFQLTNIGKKIYETLDYALASRGMVVLDGLEGRGKTEAVKAWCELHLAQARFVSLKGITSKTTAFREIAKALGIASSYTRTATEMQNRIEDVLKRSKLMLAVDEAHFVFNQSRRLYSRPELVDWIDTAICNHGIPIALVTTPQFIVHMTRAADQVEWNYRQFRRRVKRWVKLSAANTDVDVAQTKRQLLRDELIKENVDGRQWLTTKDVLAEEERLIDFVEDGKGKFKPFGSVKYQFQNPKLSDEQRNAVRHVLQSTDRVTAIRGGAGTGKTTMMKEAVAGIESGGAKVFTFAPSAEASRGVLRSDAGFANAETVEALLQNQKLQAQVRGQVIWIDEAGLLSVRTLARVADLAEKQNCRIVLSGDTAQHRAVERGDALRILEKHASLPAAELKEIWRQKADSHKAVVADLRSGNLENAFKQLDKLGMLREMDADKRHEALAGDYAAAVKAGKSALVISPTHAEGERVTREIRSKLKAAKKLGTNERELVQLKNLQLTQAQRADARNYQSGMVIQFHQNMAGFRRGEQVAVKAHDASGVTLLKPNR